MPGSVSRFGLLLGTAALLSTSGCRRLEALRQRCLTGDTGACESACDKGVAGEGGCFHAGEQHRQKGALDFGGPEFRRSLGYFKRSCDGRHADGCVVAAELVEAPYALGDAPAGEVPKAMSDAEMRDRERWLGRACELGSPPGCKRLGDVLIGKAADRARTAYEKACKSSATPPECLAARAHEVELAEKWRLSCTHGVADDCTRLGNLLYAVDVPRAVRLFASECQLRGVADISGGSDGFIRERLRTAGTGIRLEEPPRAPAAPKAAPAAAITVTKVVGQVAVVEVERALQLREDDLRACLEGEPERSGAVDLTLTVDRTGDVFRIAVARSELSEEHAGCVRRIVEPLAFTPPAEGLATVEVSVRFTGASPAKGAAPR